jgi:hypothetical protein
MSLEEFAMRVLQTMVGVFLALSPALSWAEGGAINENTPNERILELAEEFVERAREAEAELQVYASDLDPQSDTLAQELSNAMAALAEVGGYVVIAEENLAQLQSLLPERTSRWNAVAHAFDMVANSSGQASSIAGRVLSRASQASRFTGQRQLVFRVDPTIPTYDTTAAGDVVVLLTLDGVLDRGVDSASR